MTVLGGTATLHSTTAKAGSTYDAFYERYLESQETIVGAITGPCTMPRTPLGHYDKSGRLQQTGRTTTLPQAAGRALAPLTASAGGEHRWTGRTFSAGWSTREMFTVALVQPELEVEVGVDVARDTAGRRRHPARWYRARPGLSPGDVELFGSPGQPPLPLVLGVPSPARPWRGGPRRGRRGHPSGALHRRPGRTMIRRWGRRRSPQ